MKLRVGRFKYLDHCTIGKLTVDGVDLCYTLEDKYREVPGQPVKAWKVPGQTAIPRGIYPLDIDFSDHFQTNMPHIENVPGFVGIRIHFGNSDTDTDGCVLVGLGWSGDDMIYQSRAAFDKLMQILQSAKDPITIEIA